MVLKKTPKKSTNEDDDNEILELHVWGGGWGLPSIDPECLQGLAVTRFGGAPAKVVECNNPWRSPKGVLPFFRQGKKVFYSAKELAAHLRTKNYSCDYGLSNKECADATAFAEYVAQGLNPALQYFFWIHNHNYTNVVRPHYGYRLPWLYKMWYPERLQENALSFLTTMVPEADTNREICEEYTLEKAGECIQLLSNKLGTNEFFMRQNSPTYLDGVIFSYLAPFLKVSLEHNPVREYILSYSNLEKFITRISQRYLTAGGQGDVDQTHGSHSTASSSGQGDNNSFSPMSDNPVIRNTFAGLIALGAMIFYATRIGLIRGFGNEGVYADEEDEEEEDEYEYY